VGDVCCALGTLVASEVMVSRLSSVVTHLFNDAVSSLNYMASKDTIISE
jgi:hypothetical protein